MHCIFIATGFVSGILQFLGVVFLVLARMGFKGNLFLNHIVNLHQDDRFG